MLRRNLSQSSFPTIADAKNTVKLLLHMVLVDYANTLYGWQRHVRRTDAVKTRGDAMESITLMCVQDGRERLEIEFVEEAKRWIDDREIADSDEVKRCNTVPLAGSEAIR